MDPAAAHGPPPTTEPPRWALPAILAAAAALRVALLAANHGTTLDSDEAIFGLMANHILQGGRPAFFYGQQYMGALPAYLFAGAFALFGSSTAVLKGVVLVLDLALVGSFYALGRTLFSARVGLFAAAWAALPPAFLAVYGLKARVFVEPIAIGAALMAGAAGLRGVGERRRPWLAAALGGLAGLGLWANTITAVYFPAVALVWALAVGPRGLARTVPPAIAAAALGAAPFLLANLGSGGGSAGHLHWVGVKEAGDHLDALLETGWPILAGARGPWAERDALPGLGALLGIVYAAATVHFGVRVLADRRSPFLAVARVAPLLSAGAMLAAFCFSAYGREVREPRYLGALYPALALVVAVALADLVASRARRFALAGGALLLAGHVVVVARFDPALLLPVSGGARVAADDGPLIEALDALEVDAVYTDYWVAYRLAFETHERVRVSPFGHVVVERLPESTAAVRASERPAFVLLGDAARGFGARLDREGIAHGTREVGPYRIFHDLADPRTPATWSYPF